MPKALLDLEGKRGPWERVKLQSAVANDQTLTLFKDSDTSVPSIETSTFQVGANKWICQKFNQLSTC